jgi:diguanylate cyclase (GGDEF)-like protein
LLKDQHGVDVLDDILLGRENRLLLYADISNPATIELRVIAGGLETNGFPDAPTIRLETILSAFDYTNKFAEVVGNNEYFENTRRELFRFSAESDVTFPIRPSGKRVWLRINSFPIKGHPQLNAFYITNVTVIMASEELIYENTHKDTLTNLFNKDTLNYHYGLRYRMPGFHVLSMDLDDFKRINDSDGHVAGDACLKAFADLLKTFEQGFNRFYRHGGDEFIGLFFGSEATIREIARKIIAETPKIKTSNPHIIVTVSIGVLKATLAEDVIMKADKVLYRAKSMGKNR